ncbi:MAG: MBL fold metallo-hydrolase [Geobacter sp.]|nr:MBL fold metallo-hydrolase [Geobacter sp.]
MRVCLLASGSKGNSLYVEAGDTRILVDAGLSAVETGNRLAAIGVHGTDLHGIIVTHEHSDHVRGVGTVARKYRIPVMISAPTRKQVERLLGKTQVQEFDSGAPVMFRDIVIDPFPITHDAADPVGFVIESHEGKIGIATDLGIATRLVQEKLKQCRMLVLESNHDEQMLQAGPYPWHLKQRIRSRHGHLSNIESAQLLEELIHSGLEGLFLAHLSEVNNDPALALEATRQTISRTNICSPAVFVGNQYRVSGVCAV